MAEPSDDAPADQAPQSGPDPDRAVSDHEQFVNAPIDYSDSVSSQSSVFADRDASIPLRRAKVRLSRRHSAMSGVVYPGAGSSEGAPVQPAAKDLRRSVTTRMMQGMSSSSLAPRLSFASSFNPKVVTSVELPSTAGDAMIDHPPETPYEEMMVRFQIRQLQRTPSAVMADERRGTVGSSRGLFSDAADLGGANSARHTARGSIARNLPEHNLQSHLTSRNDHDDADSTHDGGDQAASFHRLERTSLNNNSVGLEPPPFESGTSSAQLGEQFDLVYGIAASQRSRGSTFLYVMESMWMKLRYWLYKLFVPLSPYSKLSQARYAIVLLATLTYVLWFPMELAFPEQQQLTSVDAVVGVLLAFDVLLTLHTGYVTPTGTIVISHWFILWRYIRTRLVLDVMVTLPLVMHINRTDLNDFGGKWMTFALDVLSVERLAYITRFVRMICACIWTVLLREGSDEAEINLSWHDQYTASFYAALLLLQGEGVRTDTSGQNLFASLSVLVGPIMLAVVFGHVAILVANFNANTTSYQYKMEEVFAMTTKLQLPLSLRERIHEYYEHLWHEYECLDGDIVQFSKELSHTLGLEVVLFKYMELVMHIPFWKDCTPDFQKQLMLRLDVRVYLPNDFIMRQGEVDDEFYMVNRGYCELSRELHKFERVTTTTMASAHGGLGLGLNTARSSGGLTSRRRNGQSEGGIRQSAYELDEAQRQYYSKNGGRGPKGYELVVSRGQAFGDLALLMNYPRAANVRAITHVEMCVLSRGNFQAVLARYSEDRRHIVVDMLTSFMQSYEAAQSRCPLLEMVRTVYSPDAIAEVCAKAGGHLPFLLPVLTARQAAERIYTAINVEIQDPTLKFGVGVNVREQLIELRDRRRRKRGEQAETYRGDSSALSKDEGVKSKTRIRVSDKDGRQSIPKPIPAKEAENDSGPPGTSATLSLQARLQRVEEREMVILKALQELQASLKVLRAQKTAPPVPPPPNRKRSAPENDMALSSALVVARPLLKRMSSAVGLSNGSIADTKTQKASPTRYADELFSATGPLTECQSYQRRPPPRLQPIARVKEPFKVSSEIEKFLSTADASLLATPSESAFFNEERRPSDSLLASTPSPDEAPPDEAPPVENPRKRLQRKRSQSLHELEELHQAALEPAAAPPLATTREDRLRNRLQRTHSQSLRSLAVCCGHTSRTTRQRWFNISGPNSYPPAYEHICRGCEWPGE
ncbi:hypothetical protein PF008_g11417 [Phytophthora fragariae]|uniref:Cyclic nucleotide-binding domain-containing protein n=1 Tax=Phytophthora fragariae TaxID=53985 RepID=A0A6G0RRT5_9STRA|nr:hypothetical protein PF008_g11417 [Phytophthora fragariae]